MIPDSSVKQDLESRLKQLMNTNGWRDSIEVRATADATDMSQQAIERELASRGLNRQAILAQEIRAALARIRGGSYGICLECEEEISPRRLAAVPWASLCLTCQQKAELSRESGDADNPLAA
jgi:DnaK suppressor protein